MHEYVHIHMFATYSKLLLQCPRLDDQIEQTIAPLTSWQGRTAEARHDHTDFSQQKTH